MSCLKRMQLEHQPLTGRPEICSDTSSTRTTDRRSGVEQVKLGFATLVFERKLEKGSFGLNVLDANMYMACMDTQYWSATNRILLAHFFRTNHLTLTVLMIGATWLIFGHKLCGYECWLLSPGCSGKITANTLQAAKGTPTAFRLSRRKRTYLQEVEVACDVRPACARCVHHPSVRVLSRRHRCQNESGTSGPLLESQATQWHSVGEKGFAAALD